MPRSLATLFTPGYESLVGSTLAGGDIGAGDVSAVLAAGGSPAHEVRRADAERAASAKLVTNGVDVREWIMDCSGAGWVPWLA